MQRTLVLNVVGLTPSLIGEHTPNLVRLRNRGGARFIGGVLPAVTCSVQATYLTGLLPREHGIVGNGWYFEELNEIWFWRQSNRLVQGEKIWDRAKKRDSGFRAANLFWWFNMHSSVDVSATPRPMYPADGRKLPDIYARPSSLRAELQAEFGQFPLFHFWGPMASIASSRWIANAVGFVERRYRPTLNLAYLPHLDYVLQRVGPSASEVARELAAIDAVCGELIALGEAAGLRIVVLSEYGITHVQGAVHPNRALRQAGLLEVRDELGLELLDPSASRAFAVADHQLAHVYVADPADRAAVRRVLEALDGVELVLDRAGLQAYGLDHARSGTFVVVSKKDRWFSYYYWLDDERAPDFARTVDIHRKPGYDPAELFLDPAITLPKLKIGWKLFTRRLGFRNLLDVIPLDPGLVKGSHGRLPDDPSEGPCLLSSEPRLLPAEPSVRPERVGDLILAHVFD